MLIPASAIRGGSIFHRLRTKASTFCMMYCSELSAGSNSPQTRFDHHDRLPCGQTARSPLAPISRVHTSLSIKVSIPTPCRKISTNDDGFTGSKTSHAFPPTSTDCQLPDEVTVM